MSVIFNARKILRSHIISWLENVICAWEHRVYITLWSGKLCFYKCSIFTVQSNSKSSIFYIVCLSIAQNWGSLIILVHVLLLYMYIYCTCPLMFYMSISLFIYIGYLCLQHKYLQLRLLVLLPSFLSLQGILFWSLFQNKTHWQPDYKEKR